MKDNNVVETGTLISEGFRRKNRTKDISLPVHDSALHWQLLVIQESADEPR